jgi:hypothetical protein
MTMQIETTQTEIRDNAYWPAEVLLAGFAEQDERVEQDARAEKDDRVEQADRLIENNPEYATLYFVS